MKIFLLVFIFCTPAKIIVQAKPHPIDKTKFDNPFSNNDSTKKYTLYFTIDDGPLEGTPFLDTVFREEKVPANLFLVGTHANINRVFKGYFNQLRNDKWFELGNHSYTHADERYDYYYSHPKMVLKDMRRNNDSLHFNNKLCRMPARNMWRVGDKTFNDGFSGDSTADLLKKKGYKVIGWDLEWESDSLSRPLQSPDSLFKQLNEAFKTGDSFLKGNVVLLCHDWMFTKYAYKQELQQFIELVKASGDIQFEWLSDYPLYKKNNRSLFHKIEKIFSKTS
ncbi:MAG: polysaccharide deacetylase family protein, partial [Ferruginibacter sp.]